MSAKALIRVLVTSAVLFGGCTFYPPLDKNAQLPSDYTYIIGPGDSVEMFVWGNPEVSRVVPVRPDGKITAPLVEELQASGKTPYTLARDIEKELSRYIRNPLVTVIVSGFTGPFDQQIRIIGAFGGGSGNRNGFGAGAFGGSGINSGAVGVGAAGGAGGGVGGLGNNNLGNNGFGNGGANGGSIYNAMALPYIEGMTLLDLTVAVGNLGSGYGAGNRASIVRVINGEQRQFGIRLDDLIEDGDMTANVELLPGDIVFIPESYF